jgi:membrane-associated phospholipid phosphatase
LYFAAVAGLVLRIALLDDWSLSSWVTLLLFVTTASPDRVLSPSGRSLALGITVFAALCGVVAYVPGIWFDISYRLNHGEHYLWNVNHLMVRLPFNDGNFLWGHRSELVTRVLRWVYLTGFDMVVWIPVVRSLVALDAWKAARYALAAHVVQFPLIMPLYTAIRADEVWSVLGDPDRCARGWSDEMRLDLGANCFPSMHTSVAFAILLLSLREKSALFKTMMVVYATSIITSTLYMEIHWVVDVLGGLLLGAGSVKLTDFALSRFFRTSPNSRMSEPASATA